MPKRPIAPRPRQQSLAFAVDDLWERLPSEASRQCHERIAHLLEAIIQAERKERSEDHERQDPS